MANVVIPYHFRNRRDQAATWASKNPVPLEGEWCLELDTGLLKLGDGSTAWNDLDYFDASKVPYLASSGGLDAETVQDAIDELAAGEVGGIGSQIGYARATSSMAASTSASIPMDATRPQNTEGTAYPSIDTTITPHAEDSLLEVEVTIPYLVGTTAAHIVGALFRDSEPDAIAVGVVVSEAGNRSRQLTLRTVVQANATAATTFKFRFGVSTGTCYLLQDNTGNITFGGACVAAMTVREIKQ